MTTTNGLRADKTIIRPAGVSTPGFDAAAFDDAASEMPLEPLPEDSFGDILDRFESFEQTIKLLFRWLVRPLAIIAVVAVLGWFVSFKKATDKPNVEPYVQVVKEYCVDPKCRSYHMDPSEIRPVATDAQAQQIVARANLPVILHQMFTVSTPEQDNYDWTTDVIPYIKPNSDAAKFAAQYLQKNNIGKFAANGTVVVNVDPVGAPSPGEPNVYLATWTTQTKSLDGNTGPLVRSFARITVEFGQAAGLNRNGLLITNIELTGPGGSSSSP